MGQLAVGFRIHYQLWNQGVMDRDKSAGAKASACAATVGLIRSSTVPIDTHWREGYRHFVEEGGGCITILSRGEGCRDLHQLECA